MKSVHQIIRRNTRLILGCTFIIAALVLLAIVSIGDKTYTAKELPDDIVSRIYNSAGGKKNVTDIKVEESRQIGDYRIFLYSYQYKKTGQSNNCIIYEKDKNRYKLRYDGQLAFKMKDSKKHNQGLGYIVTGGYLIVYGIVNENEPDQYEIVSGNMKITERYETHTYFIREYVLSNPNEVSVTPIVHE